jgi:hypothetical protein
MKHPPAPHRRAHRDPRTWELPKPEVFAPHVMTRPGRCRSNAPRPVDEGQAERREEITRLCRGNDSTSASLSAVVYINLDQTNQVDIGDEVTVRQPCRIGCWTADCDPLLGNRASL